MRRTGPVLIPTILLCLFGAYVTYHLLAKHEVKSSGLSWFDATCESGDDAAGKRSCDEVMASRWGTFPPLPKNAPPGTENEPVSVLGLFTMVPRPTPLYGWFYFSGMAAWYVLVGRPKYRRRFWHLLPLMLNTLAVLAALALVYVMFFTDLQAWCPWCLVTHATNLLMLVGAVLLWPRREPVRATVAQTPPAQRTPAARPADAEGPPSPRTAGPGPGAGKPVVTDPALAAVAPSLHPSGRAVLATLAAVGAVIAAEWYFYQYAAEFRAHKTLEVSYARLNEEMDRVRLHAGTLYSLYEQEEKKEIPIRPDDPIREAGPDYLAMVVFSDFQCPHCGRFAKYLKEVVDPMLQGRLRIVFKHYPMDKGCNPNIGRTLHPQACLAAAAAEAARTIGGNDAFWKAHDLLFAAQKDLGKSEFYLNLADQLGIPQRQFIDTMKSPAVVARLKEDIELGKQIGLRGTPSVFLSSRLVPSISRDQDEFWKEVKRRYDAILAARAKQKEAGPQPPGDHPPATATAPSGN